MANDERSTNEGAQGLLAVIGISLGVVPLVRVLLFGGEVGRLLSWVPSTDASPGRWLVPLGVLLVCTALVLALDRGKD